MIVAGFVYTMEGVDWLPCFQCQQTRSGNIEGKGTLQDYSGGNIQKINLQDLLVIGIS